MKYNVNIVNIALFIGIKFCALLLSTAVNAHEVRPSFLSLEEVTKNKFSVLWKRPIKENLVPDISPVFPNNCQLDFNKTIELSTSAKIQRGKLICNDNGINHGAIHITGLEVTLIDVLVRIQMKNGDTIQRLIKRNKPYLLLDEAKGVPVEDYIMLGFEHIMSGIDHLLFVLALILIVPGIMALLKTITAFTLAHSVTLAMATLGVINVSAQPVEACIALSIILMAAHSIYLQQGRQTLSSNKPWLMAFLFGLLHGLGFSGALNQVGLPESDIPLSLLLFNIGIEIGQIVFVLVVIFCTFLFRKLTKFRFKNALKFTSYGIGSMGFYWFIKYSQFIID